MRIYEEFLKLERHISAFSIEINYWISDYPDPY